MINYLQVLTPSEVAESNKKLEDWWASLDWNTKSSVRSLLEAFEAYIAPEQYKEKMRKQWEETKAARPEWQAVTTWSGVDYTALTTDSDETGEAFADEVAT